MNDEETAEFIELHELVCKAARRCMYDLRHCIDLIPDGSKADLYEHRFKTWEAIFEAGTGAKDYRHRLHHTIDGKQYEINKLLKLLKDNGITVPEDPPF